MKWSSLKRAQWCTRALCVLACLPGAVSASPAVQLDAVQAAEEMAIRVIGGADARQGQFPFVAAHVLLEDVGQVPGRASQYCGGTLLTPNHVLTAAHCVEDFVSGTHDVALMRYVFNRADLDRQDVGEVRRVAHVSDIQMHPRYVAGVDGRGRLYPYDVAVVRLDRPVRGITPVSVPTPGSDAVERPGRMFTVAGWGDTAPYVGDDLLPSRLQYASVPLISPLECMLAHGQAFDPMIQVCAGVQSRGACHGDSGGPLFLQAPGMQGGLQLGIVSLGRKSCAGRGDPDFYTRLSDPEIGAFLASFLEFPDL